MSLTVLVVWQLILDVALLAAVTVLLVRRRPARHAPVPRPPAWHRELVEIARDLVGMTDRMIGALDARRARPEDAPSAADPRPDPRPDAWTMVRTGLAPEEAARRGGLVPAELRLLQSVAAAAAEPPAV